MDTNRSILRSAKHFFAGTILSRISGMGRDMAIAFCFGSSAEIAAFMVAYRLANLFRRLLGEGNLQAGFVPHFESLRLESPERAAHFYRDTFFSMSLGLVGAVLFLETLLAGARFFVPPDWQEIISLSMWMAPGLFFVSLYALNASLLQCQKKYFLPALAPVFFNLVWIVFAFWVKDLPQKEAMFWLSIATTGAFGAQFLATVFVKKGLGLKEWLKPQFFSSEWRALLKPLLLGILGISAVQLNSALDAVFARIADPEGPAFLWYAIRIEQLPLALFGIALSGALLPPLARAVKAGDMARYKEMLERGLKQAAVFMLICTFGIFSLGEVGINFLYGRGDFS